MFLTQVERQNVGSPPKGLNFKKLNILKYTFSRGWAKTPFMESEDASSP